MGRWLGRSLSCPAMRPLKASPVPAFGRLCHFFDYGYTQEDEELVGCPSRWEREVLIPWQRETTQSTGAFRGGRPRQGRAKNAGKSGNWCIPCSGVHGHSLSFGATLPAENWSRIRVEAGRKGHDEVGLGGCLHAELSRRDDHGVGSIRNFRNRASLRFPYFGMKGCSPGCLRGFARDPGAPRGLARPVYDSARAL